MHDRFKDRVEFFIVYIQEAHPTDGWQVPQNVDEDVLFATPTSLDEREGVAEACAIKMKLTIPTLVDDMENTTDADYAAKPDRLYFIGADGRIAYKGPPGPFGFKPKLLIAAIESYLNQD